MKRNFTKLMAALVLLTCLIPITGWGQTNLFVTMAYSGSTTTNMTGNNDAQLVGLSATDWSVVGDKGANNNFPGLNKAGDIRLYYHEDGSNTITVTALNNSYTISNIEITYTSTDYNNGKVLVGGSEVTETSGAYNINATSFVVTNGNTSNAQVRISSIVIHYSTSGTTATYTVTFDAGDGTFVGNNDFPNVTNTVTGGSHTLPSATPPTGYIFDGWTATGIETPVTGTYNVTGSIGFTASYSIVTEHTFSFAGACNFYTDSELNYHPSSGSPNNVDTIYYGDGNIFVASGSKRYFSSDNSGYFMLGASDAKISLPTFSGYKITQVVIHSSSGHSTSVSVSIVTQNTQQQEVTASAAQTWSTRDHDYTYNIGSDYQSSTLSIKVTNSNNSQFTSVTVVCQADNTPSLNVTTPAELAYDATEGSIGFIVNNPVSTASVQASVPDGSWIVLGMVVNNSVPFTCSENTATTARSGTVTLVYVNGEETLDTKTVTITQAGNPNVVDDISDITGAGDYHVKGTVVTTSSRGFIIGDGTGYVYTYMGNTSFDYEVGDNLSITGTTSTNYGNVIQFTDAASIETVEETNYNGEPQPEVITAVPNYSTGNHLSTYLQFEGNLSKVTSGNYTNYNIAVGEGTIRISYPTDDQVSELEDLLTKKVRVHGFFAGNSGTTFTALMESVEEVVTLEPSVTVTPATVNAPFAYTEGTLALTYENITEIAGFEIQFCDANGDELQGDEPDWILIAIVEPEGDEGYSANYFIDSNDGEARTAYFKVWTYDDELNEVYSNLVTVNQAQYVVDYAELPFDWTSSFGVMPTGITNSGVSNGGNGSYLKFDSDGDCITLKINEMPGTLSYDVKGNPSNNVCNSTFEVETSSNGEDWETLDVNEELNIDNYETKEYGLDESVRFIRWTIHKATGNVAMNNIHVTEYVAPVPAITVESTTIEATAEETGGALNVTYTAIESYDISWFESDGETEAEEPDWIIVTFDEIGNIEYLIYSNDGEARTAYFKVYGLDGEGNDVYSDLVTVTQAEYVAPAGCNYVRITSLDQLTDGSKVIIAARYDEELTNWYYAMPNQTTGRPTGVQFTSTTSGDNEILPATITDYEDAYYWTVDMSENGYTFTNADGDEIGYNSGTNFQTNGSNTEWTIESEVAGDNAMVPEYEGFVIKNYTTDTRAFAYSNGNNQTVFGAYAISNMTSATYNFFLDFFVQSEAPVTETYTLEINGYTQGGPDWYLIASPVTTTPEDAGMITDELVSDFNSEDATYDLYYFDQSQVGAEWRNYRAEDFDLIPGKGYLYANRDDVMLTFTGTPYDGDGIVYLDYDNDGATFAGWNLIGNPYSTEATVDQDYYTLNEGGSELAVGVGSTVAAMQGIFVYAEEPGLSVTFTQESRGSRGNVELNGRVVLNLNGNNGVIDRAIVRFGEGRQLPKFQLNPNNTKLYIPQNGNDFAVVRSNAQDELPVNFKAAENGTYTITVNAENVEANYLHLIDNKTGADVDLLQTPSYTFECKRSDYASRFKLVFSANENDNENEDFAFISNGEIVINGTGTIQVVDMLGRQLYTHEANSAFRIPNSEFAPGVYVLRLVDGENVRTQKIVVR